MASIFDLQITHNNLMENGSECGPDLEYAPSFIALLTAAAGQQERQVGGSVLPAREPDWNEVFTLGSALLASARDLRVLTVTAQAATHKYGVQGWSESLALMADWFERYWTGVHPRLEIDGEFDPLLRANAVAALSDANGVLRQLRRATFLSTPVGAITVGDAERLLKGRDVEEGAPVRSLPELQQAIARESQASRAVLQHIQAASQSVAEIERHFNDKLDSEYRPNLSQLRSFLDGFADLAAANAPSSVVEQPVVSAELEPASEKPAVIHSPQTQLFEGLPKELASMSDAFLALSLARQYFEKYEPSHPAPILIRRIERLKGKDFLAIVKELAPDGVNQLQLIAGSEDAGASS